VSQSPPDDRPDPHLLDPDRAAADASARGPDRSPGFGTPTPHVPEPKVDTRRYGWMLGIFGLVLVAGISVYQFASNGVGSPGVPPGKRMHLFVAPLASTGPNLDANLSPRCDPARPNPRALNVCGRTPLVLAFFTPGSQACEQQVSALQAVSRRFAGTSIVFGAVAIKTGQAEARRLVRSRGWTIPIAFDRDGGLASLYGIEICPIIEIARAGGVVSARLIGEHWAHPAALAAQVEMLRRG
jgi:hypothetical protein